MANPKPFDAVSFGERLRVAREAKGLTQKQLATTVGLNYSFIAHIEAGARQVSLGPLCSLADALDTSADVLLGRRSA